MSDINKLSARIESDTGRLLDSYRHAVFLCGPGLFDVSDYVEKHSSKRWSGMNLITGEFSSNLDFRLEDFNQRDKIIWLGDGRFLFLVLPEDSLAIQMIDDIDSMIETKESNKISKEEFQNIIRQVKEANERNIKYTSVLEELNLIAF